MAFAWFVTWELLTTCKSWDDPPSGTINSTVFKWLLQLDGSKPLLGKWRNFNKKSILKWMFLVYTRMRSNQSRKRTFLRTSFCSFPVPLFDLWRGMNVGSLTPRRGILKLVYSWWIMKCSFSQQQWGISMSWKSTAIKKRVIFLLDGDKPLPAKMLKLLNQPVKSGGEGLPGHLFLRYSN